MGTVSRSRYAEPALLVLVVVLGMSSLVLAAVAGVAWFVPMAVLAAAPIVVAWRCNPSTPGRHRR